jgi:5,5'-dehydrodivanillate O-demethylase
MYKTTKEENEILTRTARGTPMGEFLRRSWWPIGISAHLKTKPTFVLVFGEDLVLFRDGTGKAGVIGAYCAHRRANLCLGDVERDGVRCRYPARSMTPTVDFADARRAPDSQLKEAIRLPAYPVEELGGLIFAYFGAQPAPLLPRYNFLVGEGDVYITIQGFQNCNWLQCVENGMDPVHPSFTHGGAWPDIMSTEPELGFHETEWGLVYKAYRKTREPGMLNYREHHLLMPGVSCGGSGGRYLSGGNANTPVSAARWSVPIDDAHTMLMRVRFKPADNPGKYEGDPFSQRWKPPRDFIEPYKVPDSDNPVLGTTFAATLSRRWHGGRQHPPIADRENENLGPAIDDGIIKLRQMYLREIEKVKRGEDPKAIVRDPEKNKLIVIPAYEKWVPESERHAAKSMAVG